MKAGAILGLLLAALPFTANARCAMTQGWTTITEAGVTLRARTQGAGPPLMMLPSLARGPADFDALAAKIPNRTVVLFEPRWFSGSDGPEDADLFALADDASRVLARLCPGETADVIGHAFGNRVARTLAARHPDQIGRLLLFASGGQTPIPPDVSKALSVSIAQGEKPDADRLAAIRLAFFAEGQDPTVWLSGWNPRAGRLQQAALMRTPNSDWQTAGHAEILVVQAAEDPVAPIANALALQARAPDRVKIVSLAHASHAMLPEQPTALAVLTAAFVAGETDQARLQGDVDAAIHTP
jgi:pimeloyl-ACP methyl ester carboxylesterase